MVRASRSYLLQFQVRNLLSSITGFSTESRDAIINGIANQWINSIRVYGVDDKNRCHVGLELEIKWAAQTSQVLVLRDRGAIAETVSTKNDLAQEVVNAIEVFNQSVEADHLRTEWYYHPELPELKLPFSSVSPADVPAEYLQALLQHRYAVDILTQSLSNTHRYPTNPTDDNSHLNAEGLPHITALRDQADLGRETTPEAKHARSVKRHVEQLREEAKIPQGIIIYQPGALPKNYETHAKQLVEALGNQQHSLRRPGEYALKRFAAAAAKDMATDKGILIEQASRKFGIPATTLASWVDMDLLPVLSRSKGAIYLDEEAVAKAAPLYHEAKSKGVQPARLLKAQRAQQAGGDPQPSH